MIVRILLCWPRGSEQVTTMKMTCRIVASTVNRTVLYGRGSTKATNYKVCLVQVKLVSVKLRQVLVLHLRRHTLIITVYSLAGSPEARAY